MDTPNRYIATRAARDAAVAGLFTALLRAVWRRRPAPGLEQPGAVLA